MNTCQFKEEFQLIMMICGGQKPRRLVLGVGPSHQIRALGIGLWRVVKLWESL